MAEFRGLNRSVAQFREWALGDLKSPTTKGMIAEYLVRCAIGLDKAPALDWDYVDIRTPLGSIEVKSSSALSGGPVHRPVRPKFGIEIKTPWDAIANDWAPHDPTRRHADVYVFCLHGETDSRQADPLDTTQWQFWIVPSVRLTAECGHSAKTVSVSRLSKIVQSVSFGDLAIVVWSCLSSKIEV
jgi:hypothetical protein